MRGLVILVVLAAVTACRTAGGRAPAAGELAVEWRGARRGAFRAPATATLCAETGIVELLAVRGDSGAGLVLFPLDSAALASADYQVFVPALPAEPRPGANAALRWVEDERALVFQSLSGTVRVEVAGDQATGMIEAGLQLHEGTDTLRLTGRFAGVRVTRAPAGCGSVSRRNYL